jgi:hypothetical protein
MEYSVGSYDCESARVMTSRVHLRDWVIALS